MYSYKMYIGFNVDGVCTWNVESVKNVVNDFFESFNITSTLGCWKDEVEHSCIIEILQEEEIDALMLQVKQHLLTRLKQQEILITKSKVEIL